MSLNITAVMKIKLQRKGDSFLMDKIPKNYKTKRIERINACRLYIKAILISDVASNDGKYIQKGFYNGDSKCDSKLQCPEQPKPPKSFWNEWHHLIKDTTTLEDLILRYPLGKWMTSKRHIHYPHLYCPTSQ